MKDLVEFEDQAQMENATSNGTIALNFVDNYGKTTEIYPANPTVRPKASQGFALEDGRVTIDASPGTSLPFSAKLAS